MGVVSQKIHRWSCFIDPIIILWPLCLKADVIILCSVRLGMLQQQGQKQFKGHQLGVLGSMLYPVWGHPTEQEGTLLQYFYKQNRSMGYQGRSFPWSYDGHVINDKSFLHMLSCQLWPWNYEIMKNILLYRPFSLATQHQNVVSWCLSFC